MNGFGPPVGICRAEKWAENIYNQMGSEAYWKEHDYSQANAPCGSGNRLWRAYFLGRLLAPPEALEVLSKEGRNPLPTLPWSDPDEARLLYRLGIQSRIAEL